MEYSQSYLKNNPVINLDNVITINPEVIRASNSHIKEVNYAHLKGTIIYNSQVNSLIIDVQVTVTITLLCALSLQPFTWTNEWNWKDEYGFDYFNCNLNYINEKIFCLDRYLWDEIFAITPPINLTVKDVKISKKGKKWQFITEKEVYNSLEQDSRWMPLKKLKLENIKEDK